MWLTQDPLKAGTVLGADNVWVGLGVFVVYQDHESPVLAVINNNGTNILNAPAHSFPTTPLPAFFSGEEPLVVTIRHLKDNNNLAVSFSVRGVATTCVEVNDFVFPKAFFSISSTSGTSPDTIHFVDSVVHTNVNSKRSPVTTKATPEKNQPQTPLRQQEEDHKEQTTTPTPPPQQQQQASPQLNYSTTISHLARRASIWGGDPLGI